MRGKKCIPGVICVENMTLFFLFVIVIIMIYMYYNQARQLKLTQNSMSYGGIQPSVIMVAPPAPVVSSLASVSSRNDPLRDYNTPPIKDDGVIIPTPVGVPINVPTRGYEEDYKQYGILTRASGLGEMILPLMGRRSNNSRDKYQYYTMTNSAGNINTKLPISVNGRSCTSEYGCDQISSGDMARVEGYNDTFRATIYESSLMSYLPIF